jgi:hypothetical protein
MSDASHFLVYAGAALIALPWAAWRAKGEWPGPDNRGGAWAWLLIALALAVYTVFAVNWIRWSLYVGLVSAVAVAGLMVWADQAITRRFASPTRTLVITAVYLVLAVGPFLIGMAGIMGNAGAGGGQAAGAGTTGDPRACPVQAMAGFLNQPPWGDGPRTILASANDGAEILYRTRHRVIGTLHHPNAQAILDSVRIFGGPVDGDGGAETLALIQKREIDLVLVCLGTRGGAYGNNGLFQRLKAGGPPSWLAEVALPQALGRAFRLYKVAAP